MFVCVCVGVYVHVYMCTYGQTSMQARGQWWVPFLRNAVHWDMVLLAWNLSRRTGCLATHPRESSLCLTSAEVLSIGQHILLFCVGTGNLPRVLMLSRKHFSSYDFSLALPILCNNYFFVSFHLSCIHALNLKIPGYSHICAYINMGPHTEDTCTHRKT